MKRHAILLLSLILVPYTIFAPKTNTFDQKKSKTSSKKTGKFCTESLKAAFELNQKKITVKLNQKESKKNTTFPKTKKTYNGDHSQLELKKCKKISAPPSSPQDPNSYEKPKYCNEESLSCDFIRLSLDPK